jgi:hypothetical protein
VRLIADQTDPRDPSASPLLGSYPLGLHTGGVGGVESINDRGRAMRIPSGSAGQQKVLIDYFQSHAGRGRVATTASSDQAQTPAGYADRPLQLIGPALISTTRDY